MSEQKPSMKQKLVEHPLDGLIEVAKCVEEAQVRELYEIVGQAVRRRKWDIENLPKRWIHVREQKLLELSQWIWLQDTLYDFWRSLDGIPF